MRHLSHSADIQSWQVTIWPPFLPWQAMLVVRATFRVHFSMRFNLVPSGADWVIEKVEFNRVSLGLLVGFFGVVAAFCLYPIVASLFNGVLETGNGLFILVSWIKIVAGTASVLQLFSIIGAYRRLKGAFASGRNVVAG